MDLADPKLGDVVALNMRVGALRSKPAYPVLYVVACDGIDGVMVSPDRLETRGDEHRRGDEVVVSWRVTGFVPEVDYVALTDPEGRDVRSYAAPVSAIAPH